jgi:hypothetical protein
VWAAVQAGVLLEHVMHVAGEHLGANHPVSSAAGLAVERLRAWFVEQANRARYAGSVEHNSLLSPTMGVQCLPAFHRQPLLLMTC